MKGWWVVLLALGVAACSSVAGSRLTAQPWQMVAVNGEAFMQPADQAVFSLTLWKNGRMAVWAGCNNLQGVYQYQGNVLRIGPFDELRRQCDTEVMQRERQVMRALEGASSYRLENGELSLRNPIGIEQARFRPAHATVTLVH